MLIRIVSWARDQGILSSDWTDPNICNFAHIDCHSREEWLSFVTAYVPAASDL
jgi:hypothetical protein